MSFAILFLLQPWWALPVQAQPPAKTANADEKPLPLTAELRAAAVKGIAREFDERYVFPEVATQAKAALEKKLAAKGYDDCKTGQELAEALTTDLLAVCKDKHVRVRASAEKVNANMGRRPPTAEDRKRMQDDLRAMNGGFVKVERLPGNLGYIRLDGFMDPSVGKEPLLAAMTFLKNTEALIIDLRYNGGGTPLMIQELCSYFFNEEKVHLNSMYFRAGNRREEFWTHEKVEGPRYLNKPVYLLTSAFTFSGAEECAYNFQTQKRGTIVGETTGGGAHPGGMFSVADHFAIFIPTGRAINPVTGTNWEGVGVKPDVAISAEQALEKAQALAVEALSKDAKLKQRTLSDVADAKRREARTEERRQKALAERAHKN
jgi:C-terminal processing protease CtpA/Prc